MDDGLKILLDEILKEQRETREDVRQLREAYAEKRGERRVVLWLASGVAGAVSTLATLLLHRVFNK